MEVIAIQKSVLDGIQNELKELLELTENATRKYTPIFKEEKWLDNQEICLMMNITKRTLQTYKDKGLLPYSKLNRKNYYKLSDVQALLEAGQPYNTNDLLPSDAEEIIVHQEMMIQLRNRIEEILKNYRPIMNGEIYLSGEDVCKLLHISKRTLQQYRDDNILSFIQVGGKIIYKESDILAVLEQSYISNNKHCL